MPSPPGADPPLRDDEPGAPEGCLEESLTFAADRPLTALATIDESGATVFEVLPPTPLSASMPERVGRFVIEEPLGKGGMGVVFLARDPDQPRHAPRVALKTLRWPSPAALMRLKREFRIAASLDHPNLVRLYELGTDEDEWFFTMERLPGVDLADYLLLHSPPERLDASVLRDVFTQLLLGLDALHSSGIRHLDLKPSNAIVSPEGRVQLLDFGVAAVGGGAAEKGRGRRVVGTPAYLAPEQARGGTGEPASDLYAVGVMLFEALTGHRPFHDTHNALTLLMRKCTEAAPHPREALGGRELPTEFLHFAELAHALLARDAKKRPSLVDALDVLGGQLATNSLPPSRTIPFVGRDAELSAILDAFHSRDATKPTILHVIGASGLGKSRLLQEAEDHLRSAALVLSARCHEFENIPFKGLDTIIDRAVDLLRALPEDELEPLQTSDVAHAAQMFPTLRSALPRLPRPTLSGLDDALERAYRGVGEVLRAISPERALMLILDDVQWGDAGAGQLLGSLLGPSATYPFVVVLAYRDDEAHESALLNALAPVRGRGFNIEHEIQVERLPAEAAGELARMCADSMDSIDAGQIANEARGNPFFIEQLALHGLRTGVPATLDSVVEARVAELQAPARRLLEAVSIAGQPLSQSVATRVAEVEDMRRTVAILVAKSLIRVDGSGRRSRLSTYHDRIRECVSHAMKSDAKRSGHDRMARALIEESAAPHIIAPHLHHAGRNQEAARYAILAAEDASRALGYDAAAAAYANALEWGGDALPDAGRVRAARAAALHRAGRCDEAGPAYLDAARQEVDAGLKMELERLAAEALLSAGAVAEAFDVLRPLFSRAGVPFPASSAGALASLVAVTARVRFRIRAKPPEASQDPDRDALFKSSLCWSVGKGLSNIAPVEGALTTLRSLLYALDAGVPSAATPGMLFVGSGFAPFMGGTSERCLSHAQYIADAERSPRLQGLVRVARCQRALLEGHWDAGIEHASSAEEIFGKVREPTAWGLAIARTTVTAHNEYRGRLVEMRDVSERYLRQAAKSGDRITFVMVTSALGYTLAAAGDRDGLHRAIEEMRETMASWTVDFGMWDFYRLRLEILEHLIGDRPEDALATLDASWPKIVRANLLRVGVIRPAILQARLASEMAAFVRDPRSGTLKRRVAATSRQLAQIRRMDGPTLAAVADAGLCRVEGDHEGCRRALEKARRMAREARLGVTEDLCAWVLGEGASARERLIANGVAEPSHWIRYGLPGAVAPADDMLRP